MTQDVQFCFLQKINNVKLSKFMLKTRKSLSLHILLDYVKL